MQKPKTPYFLAIAATILLLATGSCSKLCNSGYEGSRCNILTTDKFTGVWSATDTPGTITYLDTINQGAVLGDITLSTSFAAHHFNHVVNASVSSNIITIPYQQPDSANNFVLGNATISSDQNSISFSYQLISGVDSARIITNFGGTWVRKN